MPVWLICRPYSYRRFSLLTRRCKTSCFKKSAQNLFSHIHVSCVFFFFRHFHISHSTPYLAPQIWHNLCFSFLLGIAAVPREMKTILMKNFWGQIRRIIGMWKWRVSSIFLCCYFSAYSFHDYLSLFGGWREKISLQPHFDYCSTVWDGL